MAKPTFTKAAFRQNSLRLKKAKEKVLITVLGQDREKDTDGGCN